MQVDSMGKSRAKHSSIADAEDVRGLEANVGQYE